MPQRAEPARRLLVATLVLVVLLGAGAVWLVLRTTDGGEADELEPLREAAVETVREADGSSQLVVAVKPGSAPAAIADALDAVPDDVREATFRLGRGELVVDRGTRGLDAAATALVAVSRVRAPAARIAIETVAFERRLRGEVERPEQAAPLARELAERAGPAKLREAGIRDVVVTRAGANARGDHLVVLRLSGGPVDARPLAALEAVAALAGRGARVTATPALTQLRVQARDVEDVGAAWAAAAEALPAQAGRIGVTVDVDGTAVLDGVAGDSPRRALALLEAFDGAVVEPYVSTDLNSARARLGEPRTNRATVVAATRAAREARAARVKRLTVEWPAGDDVEWLSSVPGATATRISIADTPAGVLRALPAVRRAHEAGFPAVQWSRPSPDRLARLYLGRPEVVEELEEEEEEQSSPALSGGRAGSRRLARTIRAIRWPGAARFDLAVGPGSCEGQDAVTLVEVVSTAAGRARAVDSRAGCADEELVREFRDTWNATADR